MNQDTPRERLTVTVGENAAASDEIADAIRALSDSRGIESANVQGSELLVVYDPFVISEEGVGERLRHAGITPATQNTGKRSAWRRFIDRLASENKSSLGGKPLDCCDLNKSNRPQ